MELKSVGLNSDLEILKTTSNVVDLGNYIKIETTNNPEFFWGNFLVFPHPPKNSDVNNWKEIFKKEFASNNQVKHIAFTWDIYGGKPEIEAFLAEGFILEEAVLMSATELKTYKAKDQKEYREILSDADWSQLIELQIATGLLELNYNPKIYREFVQRRFANYQLMVEKNMGKWFGVFHDGQLICDLGLFGDSTNMRFQSIETHIDFRGLGLAQNLMAYAANSLKAKNYILQADSKGKAIDLYMKMGFEIKEVLSFLHIPST